MFSTKKGIQEFIGEVAKKAHVHRKKQFSYINVRPEMRSFEKKQEMRIK